MVPISEIVIVLAPSGSQNIMHESYLQDELADVRTRVAAGDKTDSNAAHTKTILVQSRGSGAG